MQAGASLDQDTEEALRSIASPRKAQQAGSATSSLLEQLLAVLGDGVSHTQASQLLFKARGDIARAVNLFYDPQSSTAPVTGTQQAVQSPQRTKSAGSGSAKRAKRSAGSPAKTQPTSKKGKAASAKAAQRPITSFFGMGAAPQKGDASPLLTKVMSQRAEALHESAEAADTSKEGSPLPRAVKHSAADSKHDAVEQSRQCHEDGIEAPSTPTHLAETSSAQMAADSLPANALPAGRTEESSEALASAEQPAKRAKPTISLPPAPIFAKSRPPPQLRSGKAAPKDGKDVQPAADALIAGPVKAEDVGSDVHEPAAAVKREALPADASEAGKAAGSRYCKVGLSKHFWGLDSSGSLPLCVSIQLALSCPIYRKLNVRLIIGWRCRYSCTDAASCGFHLWCTGSYISTSRCGLVQRHSLPP